MSEQTRTPAQQQWKVATGLQMCRAHIANNRAEEVAASVAALAEQFNALQERVYYLEAITENLPERQPALESPADAPEPVCPTCKGENDCQIEARYPNGDGCGYFKDCPDCDGTGFVPVEPTAAVPDAGAAFDPNIGVCQNDDCECKEFRVSSPNTPHACVCGHHKHFHDDLDRVLVAMQTLYELLPGPMSELATAIRDEWHLRTGQPNVVTDAAIRTYGRDGAR